MADEQTDDLMLSDKNKHTTEKNNILQYFAVHA